MSEISLFRFAICLVFLAWIFVFGAAVRCTISRETLATISDMLATEAGVTAWFSECFSTGRAAEMCMSTVWPFLSRFKLYRLSMSPDTGGNIAAATGCPKFKPCL